MLAYGLLADAIDEYVKIGESTAIESFEEVLSYCCENFFTAKFKKT